MPNRQYPVERMAEGLANAIPKAVNSITSWLTPGESQRPPFSVQTSRNEALAWWRENWSKPVGQQAYQAMDGVAQAELQKALADQIYQDQMGQMAETEF